MKQYTRKSSPQEKSGHSSFPIIKALEGDYRQEHLFALKQAVELYGFYHHQIEACDREIERYLHTFEAKVDVVQNPLPKQKRKKQMRYQSFVDLRTEFYRVSGIPRVVEIQKQRRHEVVQTGPYKYVRHPMYLKQYLHRECNTSDQLL
jgi:P2-related tail formation protein